MKTINSVSFDKNLNKFMWCTYLALYLAERHHSNQGKILKEICKINFSNDAGRSEHGRRWHITWLSGFDFKLSLWYEKDICKLRRSSQSRRNSAPFHNYRRNMDSLLLTGDQATDEEWVSPSKSTPKQAKFGLSTNKILPTILKDTRGQERALPSYPWNVAPVRCRYSEI